LRVESISEQPDEPPRHSLYLLYHELRPRGSEYSYIYDNEQFDKHVELFVRLRRAESCSLRPEVTFDDGHISNFEYALPVLQARGLTARFFITVGWTGKKPGYMGWRELRSLHESGQIIGAHGWSHTFLTHCAEKDMDTELRGARVMLEDKLGTSITTMSLPGGRYNRRVLAACGEAGYTHIFTSMPRAEVIPSGFLIGRLNVRRDTTLEWIQNALQPESCVLSRLERQYRIKAAAKVLLGDWVYERLWALVNRKEPDGGEEDQAG
jgi:peptidoglycan/xylan/chitin deacetylase (PgdA/CDA1 family)